MNPYFYAIARTWPRCAWVCLAAVLSSACQDECERTHTYARYEPVYMPLAEFRTAVQPTEPTAIETPGKIYIKDNYLFINEPNEGIHVFDNANPKAPVNVSFIRIPGNVDMAVQGDILYADSRMDLVALDISDPKNAREVKRIENVFPTATNVPSTYAAAVDNSQGVVVDWVAKETREVSDCQALPNTDVGIWMEADMAARAFSNLSAAPGTANPAQSGIGGSMARFTIYQNFLYAVDNTDMNLFDISAAENPVATKKISLGWGIETIFPYKNKLFIGSQTGMFIYDNQNPAEPTLLSVFNHARACDPVVVDDKYAYVTLRGNNEVCGGVTNELHVVDITNLQSPWLVKSYPMGSPYGLGKDGAVLFVCDGEHGLKVFDASDVLALDTHQLATEAIHSFDVIPHRSVAIVTGEDGIYQYDYQDQHDIQLLSKITLKK